MICIPRLPESSYVSIDVAGGLSILFTIDDKLLLFFSSGVLGGFNGEMDGLWLTKMRRGFPD